MFNRVLNQHSKIKGLNELHYFNDILKPNELKSTIHFDRAVKIVAKSLNRIDNDFWTKTNDSIYFKQAKLILSKKPIKFNAYNIFDYIIEYCKKKFNCVYVSEQTPKNIFYLADLYENFPDAVFLHLIRDPRASLLSQKNRWKKKFNGHPDIPFSNVIRLLINYHPYTFLKLWKKGFEIGENFKSFKNYKMLKFEDILNHPKKILTKLLYDINLDVEDKQFQIPRIGSSNLNNNKPSVGIDKKINDHWITKLGINEISFIESQVEEEMIKLNYNKLSSSKPSKFYNVFLLIHFIFHFIGTVLINPKIVFRTFKKIFTILFLLSFMAINSQDLVKDFQKDINVKKISYSQESLKVNNIKLNETSLKYFKNSNLKIDLGIWNNQKSNEESINLNIIKLSDGSQKNGFYKIIIFEKNIEIHFEGINGLIYSIDTLKKILDNTNGQLTFKEIIDYPNIKERFVHLILPKSKNQTIEKLIKLSRANKFNGIILQIKDRVNFLDYSQGNWTPEDLLYLKTLSHKNGLKFILEFKFLTHQDKSIFNDSLKINKHTYNPKNFFLKKEIVKLFNDIEEKIQPDGIHIGHDELHGYRNRVQRNLVRNKLTPKDFFNSIIFLNNIKKNSNLKIFMWSDMLLNYIKFPQSTAHGNEDFESSIFKIPKSIILCDWQYWIENDFPSSKFLKQNGFIVYGATWCKKNNIIDFANFIKNKIDFEDSGIISTTWPGALLNKSDVLFAKGCELSSSTEIINFSGKVFW
jgi:hypothetical protein